jgi:hypothetical protein
VKRHLALVLICIALFVRFGNFRDQPKSHQAPGALTVRGLQLGMTRADVIAKLGPPLQEVESDVFPRLRTASYRTVSGWPDPEIIYSAQGRIMGVAGESLEWPGSSITPSNTLPQALKYFPEALELRHAYVHPAAPGEYFVATRRLMLYSESTGFWSADRFARAELAVPFLMNYMVRPEQFNNAFLLETAGKIQKPNYSELIKAKIIGCFQCCKVLTGKPRWTKRTANFEPTGICPYCDQQTLLGGEATVITSANLKTVHDAWLEP